MSLVKRFSIYSLAGTISLMSLLVLPAMALFLLVLTSFFFSTRKVQ